VPGTDVAVANDSASALMRSTDNGVHWQAVHTEPSGGWSYLGFTTPDQGVAILEGDHPALLITHDRGATWTRVALGT
jgi:photosystem II stability/assembly factor-like uncharacterized protein